MTRVRFFFDYECPFCKRGYEQLTALLPAYPEIVIEWRPIEAHPRPEDTSPHTDLCIKAYYIAEELGADLGAFNRILFGNVAIKKQNAERVDVLVNMIKDIVDKNAFLELLESRKYDSRVKENNSLAYDESNVWYVPAFRIAGKDSPKLDAKGGLGLSRTEIKDFLDGCRALFM